MNAYRFDFLTNCSECGSRIYRCDKLRIEMDGYMFCSKSCKWMNDRREAHARHWQASVCDADYIP